jgi:hypothetical protein
MVGVMAEVNHFQFDAIYEQSQRMIHNLGTFGKSQLLWKYEKTRNCESFGNPIFCKIH